MAAPGQDIERVTAAHRRFIAHVERFDDDTIRRDSLLPGWTVAHVLAHVAKNADSHVRRARAAAESKIIDQYPGGAEGRAAEIDAAAKQPVDALVSEVKRSAAAVEAAWAETPPDAWDNITRDVGGRERALHELPARRWQEVEIHLVDLGTGVTHREWSDDFVDAWLPRNRARLTTGVDSSAFENERDELAWLLGRLRRPDLPEPPPWG